MSLFQCLFWLRDDLSYSRDGYRAFGKVERRPKVRNIAPFTAPENIRIYFDIRHERHG